MTFHQFQLSCLLEIHIDSIGERTNETQLIELLAISTVCILLFLRFSLLVELLHRVNKFLAIRLSSNNIEHLALGEQFILLIMGHRLEAFSYQFVIHFIPSHSLLLAEGHLL